MGAKLTYIVDGLSNTVLVGEQSGRPEHISKNPRLNGNVADAAWLLHRSNITMNTHAYGLNESNYHALYSFHPGVHISMCDDSIHFLATNLDINVFVDKLTRDGAGHQWTDVH